MFECVCVVVQSGAGMNKRFDGHWSKTTWPIRKLAHAYAIWIVPHSNYGQLALYMFFPWWWTVIC